MNLFGLTKLLPAPTEVRRLVTRRQRLGQSFTQLQHPFCSNVGFVERNMERVSTRVFLKIEDFQNRVFPEKKGPCRAFDTLYIPNQWNILYILYIYIYIYYSLYSNRHFARHAPAASSARPCPGHAPPRSPRRPRRHRRPPRDEIRFAAVRLRLASVLCHRVYMSLFIGFLSMSIQQRGLDSNGGSAVSQKTWSLWLP